MSSSSKPFTSSCLAGIPHVIYGKAHFAQTESSHPEFIKRMSAKDTDDDLSSKSPGKHIENEQQYSSTSLSPEHKEYIHPVKTAIHEGDLEKLKQLIEISDSPQDMIHENGALEYPLHMACEKGWLDIVIYLIKGDLKMDINGKDNDSKTPIMTAISYGHADVVKSLIQYRGDLKQVDNKGWTALHHAAYYNRIEILRTLVEEKSQLDVQDYDMVACKEGHFMIVQNLLEFGANPLIKNNRFFSAFDIAAENEFPYLCELIEIAERKWLATHEENLRKLIDNSTLHITHVDIIYENQRCSGVFNPTFSSAHLTRQELEDIGIYYHAKLEKPCSMVEVTFPQNEGWFWLTEWKIDLKHPKVDKSEGWQYAPNFFEPEHLWTPQPYQPTRLHGIVRRRRWFRIRKRRISIREPSFLDRIRAETAQLKSLTQITTLEEQEEAQKLYESKIERLFAGIKIEQDTEIRNEATRLLEKYLVIAEELQKIQLRTKKGKMPVEGPHASPTRAIAGSSLSPSQANPSNHSVNLPTSTWTADETVKACFQCNNVFTLFNRRHHCRWCGQVFCDKCTKARISLGQNQDIQHRVCDSCFVFLSSPESPLKFRQKKSIPAGTNSSNQISVSVSPRRNSSDSSIEDSAMSNCPVCDMDLNEIESREDHIDSCLTQHSGHVVSNQYITSVASDNIGRECTICFDDMIKGQTIARLKCLCLYHETCIESWFRSQQQKKYKPSCPVHQVSLV